MVSSNSRIMDMPSFPDDLVPAHLKEDAGALRIPAGWFPYIHGVCFDARGRPIIVFVCIDGSVSGPRFTVATQDRTYEGCFDTSTHSYTNGVLTIGAMPRFRIDYHHPHRARIDFGPKSFIELDITYRGPPLWYSKGTNPVDMVDLTPTSFFGGYDAPCRIRGKLISDTASSISFSGYGDYEHVWIHGSFKWKETNSRWIIFNDSRFCGVITKTYNTKTGVALSSTGRLSIEDGEALSLDDVEWIDDNLQPPRFVNVRGLAKTLDGTARVAVNLKTVRSVNLVIPSIYTQHRMTGKVDSATFDGFAWSETHKPPEALISTWVPRRARSRFLPDRIIRLLFRFYPQLVEIVRRYTASKPTLRAILESIVKIVR